MAIWIEGGIPEHRRDHMGQGCGRGFVQGRRNFNSSLSGEWEIGREPAFGLTFGLMEGP